MFGKKKEEVHERNPINLPWLPSNELTTRKVADYLRKGYTIVVWRSLFDIQDWFEVYKVKDGLIYYYAWDWSDSSHHVLKLENVRLDETDCYLDLWEDTFSKARKIYYDDSKRVDEIDVLETKLDFEKIKKTLHGNEVYYLSNSDFEKKRD